MTQGNVIPFRRYDDHLGLCPHCKRAPLILNVNRNHYGTCEQHKVKWLVGSNLFSSWREQSERDWARNAAVLSVYRKVDPFFWPNNAA